MWKAGQIVTIEGKRYRIVKSESCCACCDLHGKQLCTALCSNRVQKVPSDCYLKELHPKSQEG